MQADLLITNCRIHTFWDKQPYAEEMAVSGSRILAVGPSSSGWKGSGTRVLDLDGAAVVPGFIDAHNHLVDYGVAKLRSASLLGSRSIAEIFDRLKSHCESNGVGGWVLGHCFDQELLIEKRFPTREDLDKAFGDTPVLITRVCGHACVVNSAVLNRINEELPEAERRTGVLTESRSGLAWRLVPAPGPSDLKKAALLAAEEARSKGLTGIHCMAGNRAELQALTELHDEKALPVRIYAVIPADICKELSKESLSTGSGDEWLKIGSAKIFMDGSMGARTAAMREEFSDAPGNCGDLFMEADELAELVSGLQEKGFQAAVHAIGDLAVDEAVAGIEKALAGRDNRKHRHRVEHASIMSEYSLDRMASLKIIASVQPQFVVSDFWTIDRIGKERYRCAYPFRTMLKCGITLAMGSDCPVEIIDPFQLIYRAAVRDEFSGEESISPVDTIKAYALGGAYTSFEEGIKGSLEPGKLADFAVLSGDVLNVDPEEIQSIEVLYTCVGGTVYPEV